MKSQHFDKFCPLLFLIVTIQIHTSHVRDHMGKKLQQNHLGQRGLTPLLPYKLFLEKSTRIFYLPHLIKFVNFEFIFTIKGPSLARRGEELQNLCNTKEIFIFTLDSSNKRVNPPWLMTDYHLWIERL